MRLQVKALVVLSILALSACSWTPTETNMAAMAGRSTLRTILNYAATSAAAQKPRPAVRCPLAAARSCTLRLEHPPMPSPQPQPHKA